MWDGGPALPQLVTLGLGVMPISSGLNSLFGILDTVPVQLVLLGFVLIFCPTLFVLDSFVENVGNYISNLVQISFWSKGCTDSNWQAGWTIFYWDWWISWSPFVGIFIARISRGRTVREFTLGVLFIPVVILFFRFTAFGGCDPYGNDRQSRPDRGHQGQLRQCDLQAA